MATPGHITISESVYQAIRGKMKANTLKIGRRRVKHIKQPVTVYRVTI
jgi:class 3 adenylate cyclase